MFPPRWLVTSCLLWSASVRCAAAQEWTRFRGPNGSGVSSDTGFPTEFGKEKNLLWRTPVRPGKSSPILTPRHIFLTGFEDGKLFTQCFDRETGKLLWEHPLPAGGYATPSTYMVNGRQYVVIAAGGAGKMKTKAGDAFVAFALP